MNYSIDQIFESGGVKWRVSAIADTFIIGTRVGSPKDTDDHSDLIKVKR